MSRFKAILHDSTSRFEAIRGKPDRRSCRVYRLFAKKTDCSPLAIWGNLTNLMSKRGRARRWRRIRRAAAKPHRSRSSWSWIEQVSMLVLWRARGLQITRTRALPIPGERS